MHTQTIHLILAALLGLSRARAALAQGDEEVMS